MGVDELSTKNYYPEANGQAERYKLTMLVPLR